MFKFGLKLWSTNECYIPDAVRLFHEGVYQYLELFVVPNTYDSKITTWQKLLTGEGIPFVIHAPHYLAGLNLALNEQIDNNIKMAQETIQYANELKADIIIFHPGIGGKKEEVVRQFKQINDRRVVVENKPYYPLGDIKAVCNGYSPESISYISSQAGIGFCLDIGHAFCSANAQKEDKMVYLKRFIGLKPRLFHLTDGDNNGIYDQHEHLGAGTYDLASVIDCLPTGAMITIETNKDSNETLAHFAKDISYLNLLKAGVNKHAD